MKASFVELRSKSSEIVRALDRNEPVTVFYRGQAKAVLWPISSANANKLRAAKHPAFGMWRTREDGTDVAQLVRSMRKRRFDAL